MGPLIGALFGIALLGGLIWLIVYSVRKGRQQMAVAADVSVELAKLLGPPQRFGVFGPRELRVGERTATITYQPGGKNSPPTVRLTLPVDVRITGARAERGAYRDNARRRVSGKLPVLFRKETANDRFGKRIGLNVEHDTGDEAFDSEVYVESDASPGDLEALLSDTTTRQAIHQILSMGATNVEMFRGASVLTIAIVRPTAETVAKATDILDRLATIADNLPDFDASPVGRATPLGAAIAAVVGIFGGFVAFLFGVLGSTKFQIIVPGILFRAALVGLGLWIVVDVLSFLLIRGRSDALRMFSFVFFSGLFAFPALVIGAAATANGAFDPGVATPHDVPVKRQWITTSKNSRTYHLAVASWRPEGGDVEVTVSSNLYNAVTGGAPVRIVTKPGRLGWEWIDAVQAIPRAPSFPFPRTGSDDGF